jgi:hypothetical protein
MGVWIGSVDRGKDEGALDFLKRVAAYYDKALGLKSGVWRPATGPGRRLVFSNTFESYAAREQLHKKRDNDAAWKELLKEMREKDYFEHTESQIYDSV